MNAPQTTMYLCAFVLFIATCTASVHNIHSTQINKDDRKLEIFDGVHLDFPAENNTGRLLSIEVETNRSLSEGRRKTKTKKLMQRVLPMLIIPFVLQSAITPFVLGFLKFLLIKAILVGKLALTLIIFNAFRNHNSYKERDTHSY